MNIFLCRYYLGSKDIFEMCQTNPTENFDVQMYVNYYNNQTFLYLIK